MASLRALLLTFWLLLTSSTGEAQERAVSHEEKVSLMGSQPFSQQNVSQMCLCHLKEVNTELNPGLRPTALALDSPTLG